MARLPSPGGDSGNWGTILNDYLRQIHNDNGTLKDDVVGSNQLQDNSVTSNIIAPGAVTKATVGLANVTNTADADKPVSTAQQTALDLKADTSALAAKLNTADLDAQTASKITTGGTATQTALSGTYETRDVPSYVGARLKRFDPSRSAYNLKASNTRRLRAKLAAALAGTGSCSIVCTGDSTTAGYGGVIGVSDYPTALRQLLIAKGYNATPGVIMPFHNVSGGDARWASQWGGGAVNAAFSSTTTAGLTTTLTSDVVGTIVEIYSFGTGRPFTYSIDGGAAVAFAPNGQSAVQKITVTGLANTTHTIAVTSVAGSSNFLIGAQVKPTNGFVSVTNAGVGGARAFEFDFPGGNQWFSPFTVATKFNTDAILIGFGINESRTTIPAVPNYRDSLLALITTAQTAAIDVLLEAPHSPSLDGQPGSYANSPTTAAFQQYLSVVYDVADTKDVPVLDMTDRFGLFIQASANGLTYDALHLNPAGYRAKAMSWAGLLIPN